MNPSLHDKIEFDIAINCFIFDFEKELKNFAQNFLSREISSLKKEYLKIFNDNLNDNQKDQLILILKKLRN